MARLEKDSLQTELLAREHSSVIVAVRGELDIATVGQLEAAVAPLLAAKPQRLVLDIADLTFADSSAIALWVRWADELGELELRNPSHLLRRLLTTMGLAERLHLTP
jgi:anti-anti-sigma factor